MVIKQMKIEVSSPCQNNCNMCAHQGLIKHNPTYQLTLEELTHFIEMTERSGYFVQNVRLHGPGEPLLWKHFDQGIRLLARSDAIGSIFVATNGQALHKVSLRSLELIDEIRVSIYPNFNKHDELDRLLDAFGDKIQVVKFNKFRGIEASLGAEIPCQCLCMGPMLYGDKIFYYCGPPVFDVLDLLGREPSDFREILYGNVAPNYMQVYDEKKTGNISLCRHCWANSNFKSIMEPWASS